MRPKLALWLKTWVESSRWRETSRATSDESGGDVVEDAGSAVVVADALLVAFESTGGDRGAGLEVQGIRDVGSEDGGLEGLLGCPVEEGGIAEDEPSHGREFLGGGTACVTEVLTEFVDGHDFEEDVAKDALPTALGEDPSPHRRDHAVEGIEEAVLWGVDGMDHGGRELLIRALVK